MQSEDERRRIEKLSVHESCDPCEEALIGSEAIDDLFMALATEDVDVSVLDNGHAYRAKGVGTDRFIPVMSQRGKGGPGQPRASLDVLCASFGRSRFSSSFGFSDLISGPSQDPMN